jgi:hypothetical protein
MTFEEILDQAIALLRRRRRLTYRALKRQFDLNDDYLEDLKVKLIQSQRLAIDAEGTCWSGRGVRMCHRSPPHVLPNQGHSLAPLTLNSHRFCPHRPRRSPRTPDGASSP